MSNTSMNTEYGFHRDGSGTLQNLRSYLNGIAPADTLVFGTVDEMKSAITPEGVLIQTKGYTTAGDNGGALYLNRGLGNPTPDGILNHEDSVGNLLEYIPSNDILIEQAGATPSNSYDAIDTCIRYAAGKGITVKTLMPSFILEQPLYFLNNEVSGVKVDLTSEISFTGVRTEGSEFDWQWGAFTFHGEKTNTSQDVTLTTEMPEGRDFWEVADSSVFTVGDYVEIEVKPNSTNFADKVYWRMVRITAIDSATQIRVNHARGYAIALGTLVRFTKVNPVKDINVKVKSISFDVPYIPGDQTSRENASSGIAFAYADNCNVEDFEYIKNPKQAVHFEFTMYCKSKKVKMFEPIEVNSGGYNTQFSRSIYFKCDGLRSSEDRHVFDATAASNGKLKDCGSWQTTNSSFTTHGTYEHDIEYEKCYGLLQFASSGASFGENAKRMTVRNHYGNMFRTGNESGGFTPANVFDVTIIDSHFISTSDVNLDGLQMYRCEFENDFRTYQQSTLSRRDSVFEDCVIPLGNNSGDFTSRLICKRTRLDNFDLTTINGTGELILERSTVNNPSASSGRWLCELSRLEVKGGVFKGIPIRAADTGNSATFIFTDNVDMDINNRTGNVALFDSIKTSSTLTLQFNPLRSIQQGTDRHVSLTTVGANIRAIIGGNGGVLLGGGMNISAGTLGSGYLISDSVAYDTVDLTNMPADNGANIRRGTEVIL